MQTQDRQFGGVLAPEWIAHQARAAWKPDLNSPSTTWVLERASRKRYGEFVSASYR
jgi:hypothetical protein